MIKQDTTPDYDDIFGCFFTLMVSLVIVILVFVFAPTANNNSSIVKPLNEDSEHAASLPEGATNIVDLGNGWLTFDLNGNRFLFCRYKTYYDYAVGTVTLIGPAK